MDPRVQKLESLLRRIQRNLRGQVPEASSSVAQTHELAEKPIPLRDWAPVQARRSEEPRRAPTPNEMPTVRVTVDALADSLALTSASKVAPKVQSSQIAQVAQVTQATQEALGDPRYVQTTAAVPHSSGALQQLSVEPLSVVTPERMRTATSPAHNVSKRSSARSSFGEVIAASLRLRPRG